MLGDIVGPAADGLVLSARARERLEAVDRHHDHGDRAADAGRHDRRRRRRARPRAPLRRRDRTSGRRDPPRRRRRRDRRPHRRTGRRRHWIAGRRRRRGRRRPRSGPRRSRRRRHATRSSAARRGDAGGALQALGAFRLLCAHRRGPYGVATWMARVEAWLADEIDGFAAGGAWYAGRPLLVTENDYGLRPLQRRHRRRRRRAPTDIRPPRSNAAARSSRSAPHASPRSTPSTR